MRWPLTLNLTHPQSWSFQVNLSYKVNILPSKKGNSRVPQDCYRLLLLSYFTIPLGRLCGTQSVGLLSTNSQGTDSIAARRGHFELQSAP